MKILNAVFLLLPGFLLSQFSFAQDTAIQHSPNPEFGFADTTIALDPGFLVTNVYAAGDSIAAFRAWASKMRDTTIEIDQSFIFTKPYAYSDSIASLYGGFASRRDSLVHAYQDSLASIGRALMHTADMQDTLIEPDAAFRLVDIYAARDKQDAMRDSLRATMLLAASMQDTTIDIDPSFRAFDRYASSDKYSAFRDSVWAMLEQAARMQDTAIDLEKGFVVKNIYQTRDRLDAIQDSLEWPMVMRDTVVFKDTSYVIPDLYPEKDFRDSLLASQRAFADSVYSDSVSRHWAGWRKYQVNPEYPYTLNSQKVLKGSSKSSLQYNIADFYLYVNGELVKPEKSEFNSFAAGCLVFKYNDTLLLNSGLGFKIGLGVGIKIIQGMFTSNLHANKHNDEIYKESADDSLYLKSVVVEPVSQSLQLQFDPSYQSNEIITGEYLATYKKFYQKNENGQDEERSIKVRILFTCRVTGGLDTIKSLR